MAAGSSQRASIRIGDIEIDTARHEVRRGKAVIRLPKLSYRMLQVLVEAAPAVVTHDELIERVWDGRVVSPETVTQRVKLLRGTLGDDASEPRYIALVRGEGYRLIPEVVRDPGTDGAQLAARQRPAAVLLAAAALVVVASAWFFFNALSPVNSPLDRPIRPNSVAVLPFENAGLDPDDAYISDGMASTLIDQLSQVGDLNVVARTSSVTFRERDLDSRTIAASLGVRTLVEGAIERAGETFVITVGLVDGETGFRTWSATVEGDRTLLPALQREIASRIIGELVPGFDGQIEGRGYVSMDPTAYDLGLLARARYEDVRDQPIVDHAKLDEAISMYRRLTELEPESAVAWSQLAAALLYKGDVVNAAGPINRAIAIDSDSSEAQYTLGLYKWRRYEDGSGAAFHRAITLNPNNADAQEAYAKYLWHQLVSDMPETYFLRALEFDPQRLSRYADLATFYGMSGRRQQARDTARLIEERFEGTTAFMAIARTLELTGDLDEAIAWALRARETEPERKEAAWMVAELYARIGDFDTAHEYEPGPAFNLLYWERRYDEMIELGDELIFDFPGQPQIWYGMARAFAATGRYDQAIRYLRRQDIPARAISENRRANDEEALVSLAGALKASGDVETARDLAAWFRPFLVTMLRTGADKAWWPHLYLACVDSILGDEDAAVDSIDRLRGTHGMPWYPLLADAPCFRDLADDPAYERALRSVTDNKAALRARLPETLARLQREWRGEAEPIRTND